MNSAPLRCARAMNSAPLRCARARYLPSEYAGLTPESAAARGAGAWRAPSPGPPVQRRTAMTTAEGADVADSTGAAQPDPDPDGRADGGDARLSVPVAPGRGPVPRHPRPGGPRRRHL